MKNFSLDAKKPFFFTIFESVLLLLLLLLLLKKCWATGVLRPLGCSAIVVKGAKVSSNSSNFLGTLEAKSSV